jgi:hypothetical protein
VSPTTVKGSMFVSSSRRSSSDIHAFSHDARASARERVSASSGSCRAPSRSIH